MSKTVWYSGPPPAPGWWPASRHQLPRIIRWWNGEEYWSERANPDNSAAEAMILASAKETYKHELIRWSHRWWIEDCKHDLENPFKIGRATWVCRECGRDISMHLFYLHEGEMK